jgi:DedD protein
LAENEEAVLLQRRARRRLVGAIALALLIVIVLPIVFDKEPRPVTRDLVIEIPSQDSSKFNPRLLPQPPAPPAVSEAAKAEPVPETAKSTQKPEAPSPVAKAEPAPPPAAKAEAAPPPAAKAEPAPKAVPAEEQRAQAILGGESYVVPLGLFSKPENAKKVQSSVSKAGFKVFSETIKGEKGELQRVRAGPYPTREAAEKAREQLKSKGVQVGAVVPREQP